MVIVDKSALFIVPIARVDLFIDVRGEGAKDVCCFTVLHQRGAFCHAGVCVAEEHLLGTKRTCILIEMERPIHEDPVAAAFFVKTVGIESSPHEIHRGEHGGIDIANEGHVTGVEIIFPDRRDPIEGVITDGVDVHGHRVSTAQDALRAADDVLIVHEIVVDEIALISVAAPDPAVALDAVEEAFARVEMEGVSRYVPDLVDKRVIRTERALIFEGKIFIQSGKIVRGERFGNENITECHGGGGEIAVFCLHIDMNDRIRGIQRFLAGFAADDRCCRIGRDHVFEHEFTEGFFAEIVELAALHVFHRDGENLIVRKFEDLGIVGKLGIHIVRARREILCTPGADLPGLIGGKRIAYAIERGEAAVLEACDLDEIASGSKLDDLAEGIAHVIDENACVLRVGINGDGLGLFEIGDAIKKHVSVRCVHAPHRRIIKARFGSSVVEEHAVIKFKITRMPDPFGLFHMMYPFF